MINNIITLQRKVKAKELLDKICEALNILEKDFFGLLYSTPSDPRVWLDPERPVAKFLKCMYEFYEP